MDLYKDPLLSTIKFVQTICVDAVTELGIELPSFVNLDAHANIDEIPEGDFLCITGWSRRMDDKMPTFHVAIGVSTYNDPDVLRHIDLMTMVAKRTEPEKRVPLYDTSSPDPTEPVGYLTVGASPFIDPTERGQVRSLQLCTIQLHTTLTAGYSP